MKRNRSIGWGLVLVVSCVAATLAWAEAPEDDAESMRGKGQMKHGQHQPLHPGMRAQMQAHDAQIDKLVAAMNDAKGEAKIDAIAAVVNELVAQRRTRRNHLEERWQKQQRKRGEKQKEADAP